MPEQIVSKGLGDTIHKAIVFIGIDKIVGEKCAPCEERRKKLNELVPYKQ